MRRISSPPAQLQYGTTGRTGDPSYSAEKIRTFIIPRFPSVFNAFNAGGAAYSPVTVYRIWGGAVNPEGDDEQVRTARRIADCGYSGVSSLCYQLEGVNHSNTQLIGINCAIKLALGQDVPTTPLG